MLSRRAAAASLTSSSSSSSAAAAAAVVLRRLPRHRPPPPAPRIVRTHRHSSAAAAFPAAAGGAASSYSSLPSFGGDAIGALPRCRGNGRFLSSSAASASVEEDISSEEEEEEEDARPPFTPTPERKYRYFQNPAITGDGVVIVKFDNPHQRYNTVNKYLRDEARTLWDDEIHANPSVKSVVWTSGKDDGFIAGADIFDIQSVEDKEDLVPFIEEWLNFFHRMKSADKPMVCAINGPALGGGLEWALWCDYRVCTDSPTTKLGLPEVKLGLLPGFGGTQNLHPLVGLQKGLDMMLTGKDIRADRAKKMGLVDMVVGKASLEEVAVETAAGLADGTVKKSKPKRKGWMDWFVEDTYPGRTLMWKKVEETVNKNTQGKYPAPPAIVECVKYGLSHPKGNDKFKFERESFAKLAATSESEALIGIFDGMTKMKKHDYGEPAKKAETVAVMGAGLMGAGIAQVTAEKGGYRKVLLKDRTDEAVGKGLSYMDDNWSKKVGRKRMAKHKYDRAVSSVVPLSDESASTSTVERHFANADLIIEAVFEDLDLKRRIVSNVESLTPSHTIFATNTSALPISSIAEGAARPQNIVGMHYFSPVPSMPLLEIIPHEGTCDEALAVAFEVGTKQGKTCVVVKDVPGFYVNRCLGPFLVEVSSLVRDGVPLAQIDQSMTSFGMPVGPITLADEVGIDVTYHVAKFLSGADLGTRMEGGDVSLMEGMISRGWLGRKSGRGFYTYDKEKKGGGKKKGKGKGKKAIDPEVQKYVSDFVATKGSGSNLELTQEEVQDRLMARFVNESVMCLQDSVIDSPMSGDIGSVFGMGFPPFLGGPFRYVDGVGADVYVDKMMKLRERYDGAVQFEPCQLLKDHASSGKKFHG